MATRSGCGRGRAPQAGDNGRTSLPVDVTVSPVISCGPWPRWGARFLPHFDRVATVPSKLLGHLLTHFFVGFCFFLKKKNPLKLHAFFFTATHVFYVFLLSSLFKYIRILVAFFSVAFFSVAFFHNESCDF